MRLSHLRRPLLFMGCMLSLASPAAPTSEAPAAVEPKPPSNLPAALGARLGERNGDTRTIDLLVEMQQPAAGVQFNERSGRNVNRDGLARLPQPQALQRPQVEAPLAPPTSPSGLFGSGATPLVQARTSSVVDRSPSGDGTPARNSGRPGADVPPELKRWLQWPRDVIDYVRENRGFVIGCAAVLLLMGWTGSMMLSRRRG